MPSRPPGAVESYWDYGAARRSAVNWTCWAVSVFLFGITARKLLVMLNRIAVALEAMQ